MSAKERRRTLTKRLIGNLEMLIAVKSVIKEFLGPGLFQRTRAICKRRGIRLSDWIRTAVEFRNELEAGSLSDEKNQAPLEGE